MNKSKEKVNYVDLNFSLLTIVKNNLRLANRVVYIQRMIYAGDHLFQSDYDNIGDVFAKVVNEIDRMSTYEPLSGLLLCYTRYYIHMIEGPDEAIMLHLQKIFNNPLYTAKFKHEKVIVVHNHINQRFFTKWDVRFVMPPTLLTPISESANMDETTRHIKRCIQKIYNLCKFLKNPPPQDEEEEESWNEMGKITEKAAEFLPEYALLDFILNTNFLASIEEYLNVYEYLSDFINPEDSFWPIPLEDVPFDVFVTKENPIQSISKQEED